MIIAEHERKLIEMVSTKIKVLNNLDRDGIVYERKYFEMRGLLLALTNTKTSSRDYFIEDDNEKLTFFYYTEKGNKELIF